MTIRTFMVFVWGCLIAAAAVAGEEHRSKIKIAVDGDESGHRVFHFDSDDTDIDLHNMAVGESQVVTDNDGNEVTVSRTEDGLEFDVGGEKIEVADMHGEHNFEMFHRVRDDEDIVIRKHKQVRMIKTTGGGGVTIISGDEIDDATRAALEKVLTDAGEDGDVVFIDGSELQGTEQAHGTREVHIIRKEIDATN